jgi:TPR repeat protein
MRSLLPLLILPACTLLERFDGEYSLEEIQAVADQMAEEQPALDGRCDAGDAEACGRIGVQLMHGTWGREKDPEAAVSFLRRSCDSGHDYGCHDLGVAHMYGRGVEQDYRQARALFERTCPAVANSCHYLGDLCSQGRGGEADPEAARRWYQAACEAGSKSSCDRG